MTIRGGAAVKLSQEGVRAASQWWADELVQPRSSLSPDAGAEDRLRPNAETLVSREEAERFRVSLERLISAAAEPSGGRVSLRTDDSPEGCLCRALEEAGLDNEIFLTRPQRTIMWLAPGSVRVVVDKRGPYLEMPVET